MPREPAMRILIIEDDDLLRPILVRTLTDAGHQVQHAADGRAGLRAFREAGADLVISDLVMPEQEGLATIQQIKRESPSTLVVAISGGSRNSGQYLRLARMLGADATLGKPFSCDELDVVITGLLPRA
jgi:DNA-binding response OmpR family regulator